MTCSEEVNLHASLTLIALHPSHIGHLCNSGLAKKKSQLLPDSHIYHYFGLIIKHLFAIVIIPAAFEGSAKNNNFTGTSYSVSLHESRPGRLDGDAHL